RSVHRALSIREMAYWQAKLRVLFLFAGLESAGLQAPKLEQDSSPLSCSAASKACPLATSCSQFRKAKSEKMDLSMRTRLVETINETVAQKKPVAAVNHLGGRRSLYLAPRERPLEINSTVVARLGRRRAKKAARDTLAACHDAGT